MIDLKVFLQEMSLLNERFNCKLSKPVFDRYHQILTSELNTEEFLAASMASFREDTFFPTPQSLIDRGRASGKGVRAQIGAILKQYKLSGLLSDEWQDKSGVALIAELDERQAAEYLHYLKQQVGCAQLPEQSGVGGKGA